MREDREFSVRLRHAALNSFKWVTLFSRSHPDAHLQKPWSSADLLLSVCVRVSIRQGRIKQGCHEFTLLGAS